MVSLHLWKHYVHALSQVEFHHRPGRDLPDWTRATQSDREHVASLDGLALLLVFRPQGDVAAVSYWQSADGLKLLWAKNEPVDDLNTHNYIKKLLDNVRINTSTADLLDIVISMCKEKILHRVRKLAKSFSVSQADQPVSRTDHPVSKTDHPVSKTDHPVSQTDHPVSQTDQKPKQSNLWDFDETKASHQELEAKLREGRWLKGQKSTIGLLDIFTRYMGRATNTSEDAVFWNILVFSWCVTSVANLNKILNEKQVRYLSKLGDYMRILRRIPLLLEKHRGAEITIEQVMA